MGQTKSKIKATLRKDVTGSTSFREFEGFDVVDLSDSFVSEEQKKLFKLLFGGRIREDEALGILKKFALFHADKQSAATLLRVLKCSPLKRRDEKVAVLSRFLVSAVPFEIPQVIANIVADFVVTNIVVGVPETDTNYTLSNCGTLTLKALPPTENSVTLSEPSLLGDSMLPFAVEFTVEYPSTPRNGVGRHGGIFFGSQSLADTRWTGHKTKRAGAQVSNVDWIDRHSDHGIRIYGVDRSSGELMGQWLGTQTDPPSHWKLLFDSEGMCSFFADDVMVEKFSPVSTSGHIGFWSYNSSDMIIRNLDVHCIAE